jgi:hypothetical protein
MVLVGTDVANPITASSGVNLATYHGEQVGGFPGNALSYIHGDNQVGGSRKQQQQQKSKKYRRGKKSKQQRRKQRKLKTLRRSRPHPKYRKSRKHMRHQQIGRGGAVYGFQGVDLQELNVGSQGATYATVEALNTQNIPSPNF